MSNPPCPVSFYRRSDISTKERFLIAYLFHYQKSWGLVSDLADQYEVSRVFIYQTAALFSSHIEQVFKVDQHPITEHFSLQMLLLYRMVGKCSITDISVLLKNFDAPNTSVGYISEQLSSIGRQLGNRLELPCNECFNFALCSDEIFSNGKPILITVEPQSLLIVHIELADKRDAQTWVSHYQDIQEQGIEVSQLTKDEGSGMKAAQKELLPDVAVQSDTFHAVAHRFGLFVNRFLEKAYKLIGEQYECERLFWNAKSEQNAQKRFENYWSAVSKANQAIDLYENFRFLYHCLLDCFRPFDSTGALKDTNKVSEDFDTALELLKELDIASVNKEIQSIENCKGDLFTFLDSAQKILGRLTKSVDQQTLNTFCLAWQCGRDSIKAKKYNRKKYFKHKEQELLNQLEECNQSDFNTLYNTVYEQLNNIIQSSAAVECINSLLRPYLNTCKGKVTQEFLNLFMFYHNHHTFNTGRRKGRSPLEIATKAKSDTSWIDLLLLKTQKKKE